MQSKSNKTKTRSLNKKEIFFVLGFTFLFVYFFFLFKEIDFIQNNQAEFGISFGEIIGSYLSFVLLVYVIMSGILLTLCYFCKNVYKYTLLVLFGFELASYSQFLFFNDSRITNINGHVTATPFQYISNTLIFLFVMSLPTIVYIVYLVKCKKNKSKTTEVKEESETKTKPQKQPKPVGGFYKTIILVMSIIFGMQAVGWITAIPKYQNVSSKNLLYYFSIDEQLKLSKNENVITFILDRMDTDYVNEIFEEHPEDKETFSGFTYYTDNISQYPGTFPSVVGLLSGKTFDKQQTQVEFLEDAWEDPVMFNALRDNNYKINGLLNSIATFSDFSQIDDKFDNIKQLDKKNRDVKEFKFFKSVVSAAFNQFMPFCLKEQFIGYITIPNKCIEIKNTPDYFSKTVSPESDLAFYERLTSKDCGLSANEEKNVFSFVHLLGSHNPYKYDTSLKIEDEETDNISQTRGTFKILKEYFRQMKELGIYQDATIIVVADHGQWSTTQNKKSINNPPMAALFIKQAGSGSNDVDDTSNPLQTNDTAQLYHANYVPSIIELLYNNDNATNQTYYDDIKAKNNSYFDIINGSGEQDRQFYYVRWTNMNSTYYKGKFTVSGNANNKENWSKD